jgi:hypothetical protein
MLFLPRKAIAVLEGILQISQGRSCGHRALGVPVPLHRLGYHYLRNNGAGSRIGVMLRAAADPRAAQDIERFIASGPTKGSASRTSVPRAWIVRCAKSQFRNGAMKLFTRLGATRLATLSIRFF